jgi:uncharacterized membrane protein (UPF0127 family)
MMAQGERRKAEGPRANRAGDRAVSSSAFRLSPSAFRLPHVARRWWPRLIVACLLGLAASARAQLPEIGLSISGHKLTAEVAGTDPTRMQGLMFRRILPENRGMLFVFPEMATHSMWMMNTYVPLSVAFLDATGVIINIEDMQPQTQDTHAAAKPAKYALEVNQGWFRKRGIKPGAKVEGIERAPSAR